MGMTMVVRARPLGKEGEPKPIACPTSVAKKTEKSNPNVPKTPKGKRWEGKKRNRCPSDRELTRGKR